MYKRTILIIFAIFIAFGLTNTSNCIDENKLYNNDIWLNNLSNKDIKIKVLNVNVEEEDIRVGQLYSASAIIEMNVQNYGQDIVELANLDVYPYQGENQTKYFVSTSKENINGFIGDLRSGESKNIKIGITLHNTKEPINLIFSNIEDTESEKVVKTINIK